MLPRVQLQCFWSNRNGLKTQTAQTSLFYTNIYSAGLRLTNKFTLKLSLPLLHLELLHAPLCLSQLVLCGYISQTWHETISYRYWKLPMWEYWHQRNWQMPQTSFLFAPECQLLNINQHTTDDMDYSVLSFSCPSCLFFSNFYRLYSLSKHASEGSILHVPKLPALELCWNLGQEDTSFLDSVLHLTFPSCACSDVLKYLILRISWVFVPQTIKIYILS